MSKKVLEIGAGHSPAIENPGNLFDDEKLEYFGIDSNVRIFPPSIHVGWGEWKPMPLKGAIASVGALPFRREKFDYVMMKNVLGQYTLQLLDVERRGNPDRIDGVSGRSFTETISGLAEVHRVLKSGGQIVVSEEDTPANSKDLIKRLNEAGFNNLEFIPFRPDLFNGEFTEMDGVINPVGLEHIQPDARWLAERTKFWSFQDSTNNEGRRIFASQVAKNYSTSSYLITATKT